MNRNKLFVAITFILRCRHGLASAIFNVPVVGPDGIVVLHKYPYYGLKM